MSSTPSVAVWGRPQTCSSLYLREMYKQINALVSAQSDHEASYTPLVRSFLQASQDYEGRKNAADGMVKSMKRKALSAKQPKAKAAKQRRAVTVSRDMGKCHTRDALDLKRRVGMRLMCFLTALSRL